MNISLVCATLRVNTCINLIFFEKKKNKYDINKVRLNLRRHINEAFVSWHSLTLQMFTVSYCYFDVKVFFVVVVPLLFFAGDHESKCKTKTVSRRDFNGFGWTHRLKEMNLKRN